MHIFITGGTGLIGRALIHALGDHEITVLTRDLVKAKSRLPPHVQCIQSLDAFENFDKVHAIVNLAGEPIMDHRWTEHQKGIISASRWGITEELTTKIKHSSIPPHTFISGSAVGYYGDQGGTWLDEEHEVSLNDFPHSLCNNWEKIALRAQSEQTRVCIIRTGIVLSHQGGALAKMRLPYSLGLGGPIGNGKQYFPWIHIDDMVAGIIFLLNHRKAQGVFNFTAPETVTNKEFSHCLAKTLQRPHLLFTPKCMLKIALGESSQLLLDSQRVVPAKLQQFEFKFQYPHLQEALKNLLC